jgi:hypothetical protein
VALNGWRQADPFGGSKRAKDHADERELPDFDADIEGKESQWNVPKT